MVNYIFIEDMETFDYNNMYVICELYDYLPPDQQTQIRSVLSNRGVNFEEEYFEMTGLSPGDIRKQLDLEDEPSDLVDPIINPYKTQPYLATYDPSVVNPYIEWDDDVFNPYIMIENSGTEDEDMQYEFEDIQARIASLPSPPTPGCSPRSDASDDVSYSPASVKWVKSPPPSGVPQDASTFVERVETPTPLGISCGTITDSKAQQEANDEVILASTSYSDLPPLTRSKKREPDQWVILVNSEDHFIASFMGDRYRLEPHGAKRQRGFTYLASETHRLGYTNDRDIPLIEQKTRLKTFLALKNACGKRRKFGPTESRHCSDEYHPVGKKKSIPAVAYGNDPPIIPSNSQMACT